MRITKAQHTTILKTTKKHFGDNATVRLFGSRLQDDKKGGDIDLLIKADNEKMNIKAKLYFLIDLKKQLGERKIDVVFDKEKDQSRVFLESIKKKSIAL